MNRRDFLHRAALTGAALALPAAAAQARGVAWEVGCFNRPWTKWPFDQALAGVKAAGYKTVGLLSRTKDEPFIGDAATPEYLAGMKKRVAAAGLTANMGALRVPLTDRAEAEVRTQIDHAHALGLKYVLTFGADDPKAFDRYARLMAGAAEYAHGKGIALAMKPHGGISGSSAEIIRVIKAVNHRNFSIWYDAGNIIHYTGKDPVAELEPIAKHVTGFCAKDCGKQKGEVMIQFGTGKVDFPAVFKALKAAGFNGPVMVEGCQVGATPEETTANARANREFLERVLAAL